MTKPTPEIIAAALKLSIEARQALLIEGAGYLVMRYEKTGSIDVELRSNPPKSLEDEREFTFAWLPADSVAWMMAACVGTFEWSRVNKRWFILDYVLGYTWAADSPQECALKRWGAL